MARRQRPEFPPVVLNEIVYGVSLTRSGQVPLRWLDKPAKDYFVQHHDDGTIELRPLSESAYVIRATDDDLVELRKPTPPGEDYLEVRHKGDGTIWLRPKAAAERHGEASDKAVRSGDMRVYQYVAEHPDEVVIDGGMVDYPQYPKPRKIRFIHDDWDRTFYGPKCLNRRPRVLAEAEFRDSLGEERWREFEAERANRCEYRRQSRARKQHRA